MKNRQQMAEVTKTYALLLAGAGKVNMDLLQEYRRLVMGVSAEDNDLQSYEEKLLKSFQVQKDSVIAVRKVGGPVSDFNIEV